MSETVRLPADYALRTQAVAELLQRVIGIVRLTFTPNP
jgi:hypothetical protein